MGMGAKIKIVSVAVFILLASVGARAEAAVDSSAVVSRMDTIIKQMEALKAEFATLVAAIGGGTPTPAVQGAQQSAKPVFTLSLQNGETNEDIKRIQKLLATDPEIYPYGVASGFYGPKTEEGIKNLQARFGLDQLGIIGPGTKALLELFFNAYPSENFPADVLKKKPQVQGASTSVPSPAPSSPVVPIVSTSGIDEITAKYDGKEARVKVLFSNDTTQSFVVEGSTKIGVVDVVAAKLGKTRAQILALIEFSSASSKDDDDDDDESIDGIRSITAKVGDGEASIRVRYDDEDKKDKKFTVDEDDEDDIIEEVADELDLDEDDVEDLIKFDYGDVDFIRVSISNGKARVTITYESGAVQRFNVNTDDDDEIIEEIAEFLDEDEDDVEDWVEFD